MLEIKKLNFAYKGPNLFNDLNLYLKSGRVYGLLGKNGVGKTTLLKLISSLLYPLNGSISINGINSSKRYPQYLASFYLIPEEFMLPQLKIETFVKVYAPFYPKFNKNMFENILKEFDLTTQQVLTNLSYGQKKKFLIAFGLSTNTPILLMDEPTNGLDIPSKRQFRRILAQNLDNNRLIIISTHQVKDIEGLIDEVIILQNGKIIFQVDLNLLNEKLTVSLENEEPIEQEDVIYYEQVLGGYICIRKKDDNLPMKKIDLELLFNSVINNVHQLNQILKN